MRLRGDSASLWPHVCLAPKVRAQFLIDPVSGHKDYLHLLICKSIPWLTQDRLARKVARVKVANPTGADN